MSQERTRFPIQPKEVRRSAKSNRDMAVPGSGARRGPGAPADQDKPAGPPPRPRSARAKDVPDAGASEDTE